MSTLHTKIRTLAVAVALVLGGGVLYAQDQPGNGNGGGDGGDDGGDVTVPMEKQAELSSDGMLQESQGLIQSMQGHLKRVVDLQSLARRQKDIIKLNCVNDKLLQVKQLLNIADTAKANLIEAIAKEDEDGRYHEFGKIVIAEQQMKILVGEAEACIGEELVFLGATEVDADEPENPDDPSDDTDDGGIIDEPPGYASPFT